ncbi:MAG TPA: alkaline phosphatase family protein [Candidatus Methylomirabilis sp.]|nr:alkaline phosphatase family protein [Candidatus Methylomirabilis sp.]
MPSQGLSTIDHFVVVMLENRSFDNLLGFLYADRNNVSLAGQPFEGLTGHESNPGRNGKPVGVFKIQQASALSSFYPRADPGEGFANTNVQLFGTNPPPAGATASNQGFIQSFQSNMGLPKSHALPGTQASDIMGMYPPEMVPVLSGLARGYAVCDYWFSSAPTETFPNRAFVAMATSQGRLGDAPAPFTASSIYDLLGKNGHTWTIYGYNQPPLTRASIADITNAPNGHFGEFKDFKQAAADGTLAEYVFLEPQWGHAGNSQHPNYDVAKGEQFLHDVYYALYGSKVWQSTLLIITYDEHGGCYDHVAPPTNAKTPDDSVGEQGFDFTRFGVRVPTVLVSPWIEAGTVYRAPGWERGGSRPGLGTPFDHTSILRTVESRFGLRPLTKRDAAAPDIGSVLTLGAPRKDDPLKSQPRPAGNRQPAFKKAPSHLELAAAHLMGYVPITAATGDIRKEEIPSFRSGDDALAFAYRRARDLRKARERYERSPRRSTTGRTVRRQRARGRRVVARRKG